MYLDVHCVCLSKIIFFDFEIFSFNPTSHEAKRAKMDSLEDKFFYVPFDRLVCLLFRTAFWIFYILFKVCILLTRIDKPKSFLLKNKNAILVIMSSFERFKGSIMPQFRTIVSHRYQTHGIWLKCNLQTRFFVEIL